MFGFVSALASVVWSVVSGFARFVASASWDWSSFWSSLGVVFTFVLFVLLVVVVQAFADTWAGGHDSSVD